MKPFAAIALGLATLAACGCSPLCGRNSTYGYWTYDFWGRGTFHPNCERPAGPIAADPPAQLSAASQDQPHSSPKRLPPELSSDAVVRAEPGQECCLVKVGQPVLFSCGCGFTQYTTDYLDGLKITVNGEEVKDPEIYDDSCPGGMKIVYVFRPTRPGEYRVQVTPVYSTRDADKKHESDGTSQTWRVGVTE